MSKNLLKYHDTKLVKSKKRKNGFGVILVVVMLICGTIYGAIILSPVLTVGNFSSLFKTKVSIKAHSYYAVCMGVYDDFNEAQSVASGVSVMGASGYVWKHDKYYVIGNVYELKTDAENVIKNMGTTNYKVSVVEIPYNTIKYVDDNLTTEQLGVISQVFTLIDDVFKSCYNYSIRFDKGEVVATVVSSELNTLKGEVKVLSAKLDAINSVAVSSNGIDLKNALISIETELENAVLKVIDGTSTNKDLKYLTVSVAVIKHNLYNKMSK